MKMPQLLHGELANRTPGPTRNTVRAHDSSMHQPRLIAYVFYFAWYGKSLKDSNIDLNMLWENLLLSESSHLQKCSHFLSRNGLGLSLKIAWKKIGPFKYFLLGVIFDFCHSLSIFDCSLTLLSLSCCVVVGLEGGKGESPKWNNCKATQILLLWTILTHFRYSLLFPIIFVQRIMALKYMDSGGEWGEGKVGVCCTLSRKSHPGEQFAVSGSTPWAFNCNKINPWLYFHRDVLKQSEDTLQEAQCRGQPDLTGSPRWVTEEKCCPWAHLTLATRCRYMAT